jgi:hypothetical protein
MTDPERIQQSIRFGERQREVMDEADEARDAQARRQDLVRDLAMRGAFPDKRLRELALDRLGTAALTDEALELLDKLVGVLAAGKGSEA